MNTDEWHMHELKNSDLAGFEHIIFYLNGTKDSFIEIILHLFLVSERISYIIIIFFPHKRLSSV